MKKIIVFLLIYAVIGCASSYRGADFYDVRISKAPMYVVNGIDDRLRSISKYLLDCQSLDSLEIKGGSKFNMAESDEGFWREKWTYSGCGMNVAYELKVYESYFPEFGEYQIERLLCIYIDDYDYLSECTLEPGRRLIEARNKLNNYKNAYGVEKIRKNNS